ncbi:hypothetical protein B0O99DRAFT_607812 [Bisporella sp. PMI_857]|nr:hypothetical protein B0O99DRAFT_607812 [Bisporella sp. PMI_857]
MMFYEGDLQSGISKAVQESKYIVCFVTDDGEESRLWENDFLIDESIQSSLLKDTILLRLTAGSQEAAYLAAIFPLPNTPTLVVMEQGQLKEYLTLGVSKEEFLQRLKVVFQSRVAANASSNAPAATAPSNTTPTIQPQSQGASDTSHPSEESSSRAVQDLLAERGARLHAQKKEQEAKEREKRRVEAKARKEAMEAEVPEGSQRAADLKYALMQKKRQQEARDERARILKRVEDDKAERRNREEQRKAQAKAIQEAQSGDSVAPSSSITPSAKSDSKVCALQVRLFDGSTIRSRFPAEATLRGDVRTWIDKQMTDDVPYNFKHVLTPLPNRNISISEEEESLRTQGLTPSATLILVPVQGAISAYEGGGATGLVSSAVSAGYGLVSSGVGMVTGVLGSFLGGGATPAPPQPESTEAITTSPPSANINVRTLRDQDRPEDNQFYNGNALNFEPRRKDEDKKED